MDARLRQAVRERAQNRCEYCHWPAQFAQRPFTVDHLLPRKPGGRSELHNLALACFRCNVHKGTNLTGIDPNTGQVGRLFDPRQDNWDNHFHWEGAQLFSETPVGRATMNVLGLHHAPAVAVRVALKGERVY